jgi:hypothetical protein
MNWKRQLNNIFEEQSKEFLVNSLIEKPDEIKKVLSIIDAPDEKIAWRAAWLIDNVNQANPKLITRHLSKILDKTKKTKYNGVRRSLLKIIVTNPSRLNEDGELLELCFQWICSPSVPIAIRGHAMQFIYDLLPKYPELKNEFQTSLEAVVHDEGKGVRAKARKILSQIK